MNEAIKLLKIAKGLLIRDNYYDLHDDFIHNADCPLCFINQALSLLREKPTCETCGGTEQVGEEIIVHGRSMGWKQCPDCPPEESKPACSECNDSREVTKIRTPQDSYPCATLRTEPCPVCTTRELQAEPKPADTREFVKYLRSITKYSGRLIYSDLEKAAARLEALEEEKAVCREILENSLDRDKDPKDSLRDLVVVACNALYYARAKKHHFKMATSLLVENKQQAKQIAELQAEIAKKETKKC